MNSAYEHIAPQALESACQSGLMVDELLEQLIRKQMREPGARPAAAGGFPPIRREGRAKVLQMIRR